MSNRFRDALDIQNFGACNPAGISKTLHDACCECLHEGVSQREDPAVYLIVHQLAHLVGLPTSEDHWNWAARMKECEEKANA